MLGRELDRGGESEGGLDLERIEYDERTGREEGGEGTGTGEGATGNAEAYAYDVGIT